MLIDNELVRFCITKTREIEEAYTKVCVLPAEVDEFPRSADDLDQIMQGLHGKPIYHRQLPTHYTQAKYRSFYKHRPDRIEIYYASGLDQPALRYYKTKELMQIHLWQESLQTRDIVELVQNMILRASPASMDLNLGHSATSDTLGEISAMQFLFPIAHRFTHNGPDALQSKNVAGLAGQYNIPQFVVQTCLNLTKPLRPFYEE